MKRRPTTPRLAGLAVIAMAIAVAGCVSVEPLAGHYAGPADRPDALAERFAYEPLDGVVSDTAIDETRDYVVHRLALQHPTDEVHDPVEIEYYRLRAEGVHPVALVLPILAGKNRVARQFAGYFAKRGLASVIVYTRQKDNLLADLDDPESAIRRAVARHRQVLDWVETRPELDAGRIGVFGASLGGFNALFLAAADPRIRAAVPALAGADLPRLLVSSEERRVAKNVDKFKAEREWSDAEMEAYLRQRIDSDPLSLARFVDARNALMIIARHDDAVPFINQLQLRQAMGNPEAVMLTSGHVSSLIYLPYLKRKVFDFFRTHLEMQ